MIAMQVRAAILCILAALAAPAAIAGEVVQISPKYCAPGIHSQAGGLFALYVFCDDALGTNVAVYLQKPGAPIAGRYDLGKRFWQGEKWSYDVTSYSWVSQRYLLLATSYIYGSGSVYLLDLEAQTFREATPLKYGACVTRIVSVSIDRVEAAITDCDSQEENIVEFTL